jgi:hypothetical protein
MAQRQQLVVFFTMSLFVAASFATAAAADIDPRYPWYKDFTYNQYEAGALKVRLSGDSISIAPRKVMFFNIRSYNEIRMRNARAEVYLSENSADEPLPLPDQLLADLNGGQMSSFEMQRSWGMITRGIVEGLEVKIFDSGEPALTLRANSARVRDKNRAPRFLNASLENAAATRTIRSQIILWDADTRQFVIPGRYVAQTEQGLVSGTGLRVDLNFNISPLR